MAEFVAGGRGIAVEHALNWFSAGWELFKKQVGMWIVLGVVTFPVFFVPVFIPIVGALLSIIVRPVIDAGVLVAANNVDEGRELEVAHLFAGFRRKLVPLATVGALALAVWVTVALLAGQLTGVSVFALLGYGVDLADLDTALRVILTGLIVNALMLPVTLAMRFAPALVMFHDRSALAAMKESFSGCVRNIVPLIVYFLVTVSLWLLAGLTCGLGWLVLWPVLRCAYYASYKAIYLRGSGTI